MADLPTVITLAGLQPQAPSSLREQLLASVAATNPGYTANLPGSLIEDIASTDVASIALCDSARVELVNSLTPFGANSFILNQLGQIYGVQRGGPTNTSVFVIFLGTPGFVISVGFTVSDGTYQYVVQDGGIVGAGGTSLPLFCLAVLEGSWAVPAGTVVNLITSVPGGVTLSVDNPEPGIPSAAAESEESYRSRVLQAGLAASQGMASYVKTLLGNVPGVQTRLVSLQQQVGGGWTLIAGGGDPYFIADAIFRSLFDISTLVGSTLRIVGITNANPGVITTDLDHGYASGQVINISGVVGVSGVNGSRIATVISDREFSIGVNTTASGTYASGGVVTPNLRNVSVTINNTPDTYTIPFVNPPAQTVTMAVTWNTTATNFVSTAAVAQLGAPAIADYINTIPVGVPINLFELQSVFQAAISSVLPPQLLTRMIFAVSINGVGVSPESGTGIIAGDPQSYFLTDSGSIVISQG